MSGPQKPGGTTTILFSDLVGYTALFERLGDEAAERLCREWMHDQREIVSSHAGEVVKDVADMMMAVFASARDAASCAVHIMQAIEERNSLSESECLITRIGIHAGEPIRVAHDYAGMPVIIASRLSATAGPGQIVASALVRDLVGSRGGLTFKDLETWTLRGISRPVAVCEVVWRPDNHPPRPLEPPADASRRVAPPKTALILFADVVDSTSLTEQLGDVAFRDRSAELDTLLRAVIRENGGSPVEGKVLGDGVMAVFVSGREAIMCALRCEDAADASQLRLHLGIHAGDVLREGNNVYGGAVNLASRIAEASLPGQILVSDTVRSIARTSTNVEFEDRGELALKGVAEPQRLFAVSWDAGQRSAAAM